jgi:hypothetical protein
MCCGMMVKRLGMLTVCVCEENEGTECVDGRSTNSDVEETDTDC